MNLLVQNGTNSHEKYHQGKRPLLSKNCKFKIGNHPDNGYIPFSRGSTDFYDLAKGVHLQMHLIEIIMSFVHVVLMVFLIETQRGVRIFNCLFYGDESPIKWALDFICATC